MRNSNVGVISSCVWPVERILTPSGTAGILRGLPVRGFWMRLRMQRVVARGLPRLVQRRHLLGYLWT